MKKWYRKLILSIAIIPAIAIIALTICRTVELPPQPTQEEYSILKDYALQIASGANAKEIEKNGVKVVKIANNNSFLDIVLQDKRCEVIAKYPINKDGIMIENGRIYQSIEYERTKYYEKSRINTKRRTILEGLASAILWAGIFLIIFLAIPIEYKRNLEKEKRLKNPDKRDCYT